MQRHATEKHRGNNRNKEKVNVSDLDNNGETSEHEENIDNEETEDENHEDVQDNVTAYLKEYRKRKKESDKVSAYGGPRAHSPGFHKL